MEKNKTVDAQLPQSARRQEDLRLFQTRLWRLVGKQAERYTLGYSSSVRAETAEELTKSVLFCLRKGQQQERLTDDALLAYADLEALFLLGRAEIQRQLQRAKFVLAFVRKTAFPWPNIAYQDTLQALEHFFRHYDYELMAHDIPCMIDYQLFQPLPDLEGIDYIEAYLQRLLLENSFCGKFAAPTVIALLQAYVPDYQGQLINLFEPVFVNALGCLLLGQEPHRLDISEQGRQSLTEQLRGRARDELEDSLVAASRRLTQVLRLSGALMQQYCENAARELSLRLWQQGWGQGLAQIFLSLPRPAAAAEALVQYQDGVAMADEDLRRLIAEMSACRYLEDKLLMLKRQVHSLRDLLELLPNCFFGEELTAVYRLLTPQELALLRQMAGQDETENRDAWPEWLQKLP